MKKEHKNAIKILRAGGIILYPTDTIWGIGCDSTNTQAIEKKPKLLLRKNSTKINKEDLNKTWYLKTAIIANECSIKCSRDIFEGPKYLIPLTEFIVSSSLKYLFTVPE